MAKGSLLGQVQVQVQVQGQGQGLGSRSLQQAVQVPRAWVRAWVEWTVAQWTPAPLVTVQTQVRPLHPHQTRPRGLPQVL